VYRPEGALDLAGGKGLNVARAAGALGLKVQVTGPLGGRVGDWVRRLARDEGLDGRWVSVAGETRSCLSIADPVTGLTTDVNLPGPELSGEEWSRVVRLARECSAAADVVAVSGSLPREVGAREVRALVGGVGGGCPVAVDLAGEALVEACAEGVWWAKGNAEEVSGAIGRQIHTPDDAADAALTLVKRGAANAMVSLGPQGIVVACSSLRGAPGPRRFAAAIESPPGPDGGFRSTVGCGDVLLAGLLAALGPAVVPTGAEGAKRPTVQTSFDEGELAGALRLAVAAATANLYRPGAARFDRSLVETLRSRVRVVPL
jgi:fructose-1-phosphate kinase PfkB-like protein